MDWNSIKAKLLDKNLLKQLAIWIVTLLFLGEMLYSFFIHQVEKRKVVETKPIIEPAIFTANVSSIEMVSTDDADFANAMRKADIPVIQLENTYMANEGLEKLSNLSAVSAGNVSAVFTEKLTVVNVTLANGTIPAYYDVELKLKRFIPLSKKVALSGKVAMKNGSIVEIYPSGLFFLNKGVNETAQIINVSEAFYNYTLPFENRTAFRGEKLAHISDIVLTNYAHETPYTSYVGNGYVIVNKNFTNITELKQDFKDAKPKPSYLLSPKPLDLPFNYTFVEKAIVYVPKIGSIPLTLREPLSAGSNVSLVGNVTVSGDWILKYELSVGSIKEASKNAKNETSS